MFLDAKKSFLLYRKESFVGEGKTEMVYIEEVPEERTYSIRVEGDVIEDILLNSHLPEKLKMTMREDVVDIVKGYNNLVVGKVYSEEMRQMSYEYFRNTLSMFCMKHGSFYAFDEDDILI